MYSQLLPFASLSILIASVCATSHSHSQLDILKRQIPSLPCATGVHVIAAGGDGAQNIGLYGLIESLATSVLQAIPGSTNVTLPYPKADPQTVQATAVGTTNLQTYISQYHNACPASKIVLLGYSAGAIITMDLLCGSASPWPAVAPLTPSLTNTIIATIVYGDETFVGGQSYDRGTCTGKGTFPRANLAGCASYADSIQSYCNSDDPDCCLGSNPEAHFTYPQEYDVLATQFIVNRFYYFRPPTTSSAGIPADASTTTGLTTTATISITITAPGTTTTVTLSTATPSQTSSVCPSDLDGDFQYPHLIIPVVSTTPTTAYGTSYDGTVNATTSSIFNFDVPIEYASMTCTLLFVLPQEDTLKWSSYTLTPGAFQVEMLDAPAFESTTFANQPSVIVNFGPVTVNPGSVGVLTSGACAAGETVAYKLSAIGTYAISYFQEGMDPIGLYIRAC